MILTLVVGAALLLLLGLTFVDVERELEQKRGELARFIADHKDADGQWDMSAEDLQVFHDRNDELTRLGKQYDRMKAAELAARENERALKEMRTPSPVYLGGTQVGAGDEDKAAAKSIGELFIESPAFKEKKGDQGPVSYFPDVDLKTLFQTTAGWAPEVLRSGRVVLSAQEQPSVVDLIPMVETSQSAIKYMEETTYTNSAAETAEGGAYSEAALALTEQTSNVRKIAVLLPVTDEQLEDVPFIRDYIDSRLTLMLKQRLDQQIVAGNGTAPNLRGILNVSGIQTQAKGADPATDTIFKAMTKVRVTGKATASGVLFHPNDWQDLRLLRTADGLYIMGNPTDRGPERLWGLPVAGSTNETENTALVADFANFMQLAIRKGVEIQISNSHSDYFAAGKQAIRADFRVAFVVYRPSAVCSATGI